MLEWSNLFAACDECQRWKGAQDVEGLLKPDEASYEFRRYFEVNHSTGRLEPKEEADPADQERARKTIVALGLNSAARLAARQREARKFNGLSEEARRDLRDTFNYRFALE